MDGSWKGRFGFEEENMRREAGSVKEKQEVLPGDAPDMLFVFHFFRLGGRVMEESAPPTKRTEAGEAWEGT